MLEQELEQMKKDQAAGMANQQAENDTREFDSAMGMLFPNISGWFTSIRVAA